MKNDLDAAIITAATILNLELTAPAIALIVRELSVYEPAKVSFALQLVMRECKGRINLLAEVIERLKAEDGRPGADEAFASIPMSEFETTVWTSEAAEAYGVILSLLGDTSRQFNSADKTAARMAFRDTYNRIVARERAKGVTVQWQISLGFDEGGRLPAIRQAVEQGKLTLDRAQRLYPALAYEPDVHLPLIENLADKLRLQ